jgi:hypothetical protein
MCFLLGETVASLVKYDARPALRLAKRTKSFRNRVALKEKEEDYVELIDSMRVA